MTGCLILFVIIAGPTGTGKSETAVIVAEKAGGEVVSADSMQVYKNMDIGTSKLRPGERRNISHHMISAVDAADEYSAALFKKNAEKIMDSIKKRGKLPILAGGTGLYINCIIRGMVEPGPGSGEIRRLLKGLEKTKGPEHLYLLLKEKDPEEAQVIDRKNPRRVMRALEIIMASGKKISEMKKETSKNAYPDKYLMFVLNMERKKLHEKINARVDAMVSRGLLEEVKKLRETGIDDRAVSMQAIGYREIAEYLRGSTGLEQAIESIKQNTRRYAKRQVTWFKRYSEAVRIDVSKEGPEGAAREIIRHIDSERGKNG